MGWLAVLPITAVICPKSGSIVRPDRHRLIGGGETGVNRGGSRPSRDESRLCGPITRRDLAFLGPAFEGPEAHASAVESLRVKATLEILVSKFLDQVANRVMRSQAVGTGWRPPEDVTNLRITNLRSVSLGEEPACSENPRS